MRFSCTGVLPCSCGASSLLPLWEGMRSVGLTAGHCRALQGTELLCLLHLHVSDAQIELAGIAQSNITKLWG